MYAGIEANYSPELTLLDINKNVSYVLVLAGAAMILTAGFGWTAAATKNEPLAFCVSRVSSIFSDFFSSFSSATWRCVSS